MGMARQCSRGYPARQKLTCFRNSRCAPLLDFHFSCGRESFRVFSFVLELGMRMPECVIITLRMRVSLCGEVFKTSCCFFGILCHAGFGALSRQPIWLSVDVWPSHADRVSTGEKMNDEHWITLTLKRWMERRAERRREGRVKGKEKERGPADGQEMQRGLDCGRESEGRGWTEG
jgi:hypothetical protein